ncbi:MAG TPA: hypothetical protein VL443_24540 [Cyclobacteriaceae bacterium]|jgi:hypothetical protein|nr:hypothetical protein [Cyclobacteriaceae bacterium]
MKSLQEICSDADKFKQKIYTLKERSPIYPDILIEKQNSKTYASTLIRIERDGVWYKVHVVEIDHHDPSLNIMVPENYYLIQRLLTQVYYIQFLYKICGREDVDVNQESELERIIKVNNIINGIPL